MAELRARESISARALEFLILTTTRTGEVIEASRGEFDLKKKEWTIPAGRMKGKKQHRVPLSDRAVEILQAMPSRSRYTFAKENGEPLSNMAMLELLRGMRPDTDLTVHGFRSTFRDWAAERTNYPNHVVEMQLAHKIPDKVEAAYRRGELFAKRKNMMKRWAAFLVAPSPKPIPEPARRPARSREVRSSGFRPPTSRQRAGGDDGRNRSETGGGRSAQMGRAR